jgi:hypothetical protein
MPTELPWMHEKMHLSLSKKQTGLLLAVLQRYILT